MKKYRKSKKEAEMYKDENGTSPDGLRLSNLTGIPGLTGMTKVYHMEVRQPPTHSRCSTFPMRHWMTHRMNTISQNRCTRINRGASFRWSISDDHPYHAPHFIQRKNDSFSEYSTHFHAPKPPTHFANGQHNAR